MTRVTSVVSWEVPPTRVTVVETEVVCESYVVMVKATSHPERYRVTRRDGARPSDDAPTYVSYDEAVTWAVRYVRRLAEGAHAALAARAVVERRHTP